MGATIMGRNMFGPVRGPWRDPRSLPSEQWTGWWGDEPPFHHPVFVLTHHPRESLTMAGGTTFHFVVRMESAGGSTGFSTWRSRRRAARMSGSAGESSPFSNSCGPA